MPELYASWYDPREYGAADDGKLTLLTFLHGTSNALVGDVCIDEFHPFEEKLKDRMDRLERMKNAFLFLPEWTRNGDKGIASIDGGIEMGQHCLMNAIQSNLMFDDGMPMDPRLPDGLTGWIAEYAKNRRIT